MELYVIPRLLLHFCVFVTPTLFARAKFFHCISLFVYSLDCLPILDDPPLPSKRFFARALFHVGDLCDEKQLPMFQAGSATEQRKEEVMRKREKKKSKCARTHILSVNCLKCPANMTGQQGEVSGKRTECFMPGRASWKSSQHHEYQKNTPPFTLHLFS